MNSNTRVDLSDVHGDEWTARLSRAHNAKGASADDIAAAKRLLGDPSNSQVIALRERDMLGSTGTTYRVTERVDTVKGGTYVHCTCPGWGFARGKGKECRHAIAAREDWTEAPAGTRYRVPCPGHAGEYQTWCPSCRAANSKEL